MGRCCTHTSKSWIPTPHCPRASLSIGSVLFVCLSFGLYVFVYTYIVSIHLLVFIYFCLVSICIGHYLVIINWSILFYRVEVMFLPL